MHIKVSVLFLNFLVRMCSELFSEKYLPSSTKNFLFTLGVEEEHTARCYKQEKNKQTNMSVSVSRIPVRYKKTKLWLHSIGYFQYVYKYIL